MIRIDLHSHSFASPDGGIKIEEYDKALKEDKLDYIAITDHDTISGALKIKKMLDNNLANKIIVGQEITTKEGEIIGLYLTDKIKPHQSALETVKEIKKQNGIVYIPHPFETVRKGLTLKTINEIRDYVDIVEIFNGRAIFQNKGPEAIKWTKLNNVSGCASSDAHGFKGLGTCYTIINENLTKYNIINQLQKAKYKTDHPPLYTLLYPKLNRLRGKLGLRN